MGTRFFKRWQAIRLFSDEEAAEFFKIKIELWKLLKSAPQKVPGNVMAKVLDKSGIPREVLEESFMLGFSSLGETIIDEARSVPEEEVSVYELRKYRKSPDSSQEKTNRR